MTYDKEWYYDRLAAYALELVYQANLDTFLVNNCQLVRERRVLRVIQFAGSERALIDLVCDLGDILSEGQEEDNAITHI